VSDKLCARGEQIANARARHRTIARINGVFHTQFVHFTQAGLTALSGLLQDEMLPFYRFIFYSLAERFNSKQSCFQTRSLCQTRWTVSHVQNSSMQQIQPACCCNLQIIGAATIEFARFICTEFFRCVQHFVHSACQRSRSAVFSAARKARQATTPSAFTRVSRRWFCPGRLRQTIAPGHAKAPGLARRF